MAAVSEGLAGLQGVRHLNMAGAGSATAMVTADVRSDAADAVLAILERLGVTSDDIVLTRLERIADVPEETGPFALVWADVLGQARVRARATARYLVLMATAGVIAGLAVVNDSSTLVVGAMAISPDLFPVTAACTGIVFRRLPLFARGLAALIVGLAFSCALAAVVGAFMNGFGLLPAGFELTEFSAAQTHVSTTTILVAFAAGVAGMLAVETRASSAVGVAISVTTIPAAAYLGIALGIGELSKSLSALGVLGANIAMMLLGGSLALAVQRAFARSAPT